MSGTITINGVQVAIPDGAIAYKYADPIEDARWIYDERELLTLKAEGAPIAEPVEEACYRTAIRDALTTC